MNPKKETDKEADTAEIHSELADEFLESVCNIPKTASFGNAWLAYEKRHWDFYETLFYSREDREKDRVSLASKYDSQREEVCQNLHAFLLLAPSTIQALMLKVKDLVGGSAKIPVYFSVALQDTDARGDKWDGHDVLVFNARHSQFAQTSTFLAVITHELIHAAQNTLWGKEDQSLSAFSRSLYHEGAAVFGVKMLFPELKSSATGLTADEREQAKQTAPQAAREILPFLNPDSNPAEVSRYFEGGKKDPLLPPKMGYYLADLIFHHAASFDGPTAALQMNPKDFLAAAKRFVKDCKSPNEITDPKKVAACYGTP